MRKKILICFLSVVMLISTMPMAAFAEETNPNEILTSNREEAKDEFNIDDNLIFEAKSTNASGLNNEIYAAAASAAKAGASKMAMVHVTKDISVNTSIFVVKNVVLVGEGNHDFTFEGEHSIYVEGVVFGGNYDGSGMSSHIFTLRGVFYGKNGCIEKTYIANSNQNGIYAAASSTGGRIINNDISNCNKNGVLTEGGASIALLEGNEIHQNVYRGVYIQAGSNVKSMIGNEIYSNGYSNLGVKGATGKQAYAILDSNNKIYSASKQGISVGTNGLLKIQGNGNVIEKNSGHGVEMATDSKLEVSGSVTITPNSSSQWGLKLTDFCRVNIANSTIKGVNSVFYDSSCSFTRNNCSISGKITKVDYSIAEIKSFKVATTNCNTCTLTWDPIGLSRIKYQIYRSESSSGSWGNPIATTTSSQYADKSVIVDNKYYYKVRPYIEHDGKKVYGSYTPVDWGYPHLNEIIKFNAVASDSHSTKISWAKCANKDAQIWIYRGLKPTGDWGGTYAKVKAGSTSFAEQYPKVKPGIKYYYMAREVIKGNDGKYHYGPYTKVDYAYPKVVTPSGFSAWAPNKTSCKCSWNGISGTNIKYLVYRGLAPSGDWGNAKATLDKTQTTYTDKNVKTGTKYYYMVRAVETIQGTKFYSDYTKVDYAYPR